MACRPLRGEGMFLRAIGATVAPQKKDPPPLLTLRSTRDQRRVLTSGGNEKDVEEESANAYVFSPVTVTANRAARSLLVHAVHQVDA